MTVLVTTSGISCYDIPYSAGDDTQLKDRSVIIGDWKKVTESAANRPASAKVTEGSEEGHVQIAYDDAGTTSYLFSGVMHEIDGSVYLSVTDQNKEAEEETFSIFHLQFEDEDTIRVSMLKNDLPVFFSRQKFQDFLFSAEREKIIEESMTFKRVNE